MCDHSINRRQFLIGAGALGASTLLPLRMAFAAADTNKRLFVIIQRGAMDGLGAVIPFGDPNYASVRGSLAMPNSADAMIDLDGHFALAKAMEPMHALYTSKELLLVHACATPYRERSHFDAQDVLENGGEKTYALKDGWLNRALQTIAPSPSAVAISPSMPLLLRGNASVKSWTPSKLPELDADYLNRTATMYEKDPLLSKALMESNEMKTIATNMGSNGPDARNFVGLMQSAANFLGPSGTARVGSIDLGGWDTHAGQGTTQGRLPNNLRIMAQGIAAFKTAMGTAWNDTVVLCITEFGRTVRPNGTGGTDHGTASVAMVMGGRVNGGRVAGDWPGLAKLYQDRDLMPANDMRAVLKAVLAQHLGVDEGTLANNVFPGSAAVAPMAQVMRA